MKTTKMLLVLFLSAAFVQAQVTEARLSQAKGEGNTRVYDFDFVQTEVTAVMQALAVTAGVDIVVSPDVKGLKVDLKVTKKTWQEALDIVCRTYDLTWVIGDKYISVLRTTTWQNNQIKAAQKAEEAENLAPLIRKNFQIRHAKASELFPVLAKMASPRGALSVVERNNAIIVYDTEARIRQMENTLKELDVETQQILITAKLVVVDSKLARELGVDWSTKAGYGNKTASTGGQPASPQVGDSRNQVTVQSFPLGTTPTIPNAPQTITMSVLDGKVGMGIYNALGESYGEILASPQISTLDHTEASIFMGDKISIRVIDANGQAATQLVESGIKLTVTPHVTGDNRIMLDLYPQNNSYSYDDKGQPVISTQEARTKVVVADGETVIIAGLTKNDEQEAETGVPFLKDIPILGYLFKYYKKQVIKKDLMIFVTPRIQRNQFAEIRDLNAARGVQLQQHVAEPVSSSGTATSGSVSASPQNPPPAPPVPEGEWN